MAETLLSFGVQKLWDLLARESELLQGFDKQFDVLKRDLNLLRSFLEDADAKKHTNKMVRTCVEEIKEIVFDTEDLIETFIVKKALGKTSITKRMRRLSWGIVDRMKIVSDMGGISERISKVISNMQSFGVQQMTVDGGKYSHPLQERQREMLKTFPSNNENELVGLEENVKKLVGCLVEEDGIQVVSITGMGGIGKTTLARQVFNHEMVKKHFDGVVWVCITQHFKRKYVWHTILQKLSSKNDEKIDSTMTEDELQDKLYRLLESGNSLIVLDDLWKEEDWDMIKPVFPSKKGWKVLLTSRNEDVALHADPRCFTFKPNYLTTEESWTLFRKISFPRENTTEFKVDDEMEEMGKQMIKCCGGLPLAIKVLGGLLASQYTSRDWKRISKNIRSRIAGGTGLNDRNISSVYHILYMSFEELPIYLKHCFLYLAHFPEYYEISVIKLSYLWAGEGIQRPRCYDGATNRDVGDGYIEELVKRNMVISSRDARTSRFHIFHLHDMMREVCLFKAEEENFLQIVHGTSVASSKSRRLAVHRLDETLNVEGEMNNPSLRSLLFLDPYWNASSLCFTRLQMMRVLDLSYADFKGGKLPSSIGKLIHLKYLSLAEAKVSYLPSSLGNLMLLIYLNLRVRLGGKSIFVPNVLMGMRNLSFLELPFDMHKKTNLELSDQVKLETLENFSTMTSNLEDLRGMVRLRNLSIGLTEEISMETLSASIGGLRDLELLSMRNLYESIGSKRILEERLVLDFIHLKWLYFGIYMPKLPKEQHFPSHLTSFNLEDSFLEEDPMPFLEKLLHLEEVRLHRNSFCGSRMECSGCGFPRLQKLYLDGLYELEEWIVEVGSMPLLHSLEIWDCPKLKELPDGLRFITSLKKLFIHTAEREFQKKLSKEGNDYYKVQHIPLVDIIIFQGPRAAITRTRYMLFR